MEKKYKSLLLFKRNLLRKSFINFKKFVEFKEKKFLIRREISRSFEKKLKRMVFAIIHKNYQQKKAKYEPVFNQIRKRKLKKTLFSLKMTIFNQKAMRNRLETLEKKLSSQKLNKIFDFWHEKTTKNAIIRHEKSLALISYKLTLFSSFFARLKHQHRLQKRLKKFEIRLSFHRKLRFFALFKKAFKFSKFSRFFL